MRALCLLLLLPQIARCYDPAGLYMLPPPSGKSEYVIGGWKPGSTAKAFMREFRPIFEDHLTAQLGALYDPPIRFKLIPTDWPGLPTSHHLIEEGTLDFVYTARGYLTCIENHLHMAPVATLDDLNGGRRSSAVGALVYSLASNAKIRNISDFKGKRLGFGHAFTSAFHLGAEMLMDHGVHPYRDPAQVIFYSGDYERQLEDIRRGHLDVAVVNAGFMEASHPDLIESDALRFHHLVAAPQFQGEPYPFLTSTDLVPGYGLAASERILSRLREQVYSALAALNATHPLCRAAGIAGFVAHASYERPRAAAIRSGVMYPTDEPDPLGHFRYDCHAPVDGYYHAVTCPEGCLRDTPESAELACQRSRLYCPPDLACLCRPCIKDLVLQMYPVEIVLGMCVALFGSVILVVLCARLGALLGHPGNKPGFVKKSR